MCMFAQLLPTKDTFGNGTMDCNKNGAGVIKGTMVTVGLQWRPSGGIIWRVSHGYQVAEQDPPGLTPCPPG